jgi:formyltetrahydrofolate deformylase
MNTIMKSNNNQFILTLMCADGPGIVAEVTNALAQVGAFINELAQHSDRNTNRFFMRVDFTLQKEQLVGHELMALLSPTFERFNMEFSIVAAHHKPRTLIMVSKLDHCLNHMLHRVRSGSLPIDVVAVVSNHSDLSSLADWYKVPFHVLPITKENKAAQEQVLLNLVTAFHVELVVLARYMQVLSEDLCSHLPHRIINIHHSFLPSFKGAKPYHQAFERGVKLIGATAHYVTSDLDEGPIIEQETTRVHHGHSPEQLVAMGRDVEAVVLTRAVQLHAERRVFLNGNKTVVLA